ncbi:MAG: hypothetical protein AB4426_14880 [Xenococcaceae cyanobacterium]
MQPNTLPMMNLTHQSPVTIHQSQSPRNSSESDNHNNYRCCFCRHFQLEGYRWGYCQLLNVDVKGNLEACSASIPPFKSMKKKIEIDLVREEDNKKVNDLRSIVRV